MARLFDGTNDTLQASIDLSAYNKISIVMQLYWDAFANDDGLALQFHSGGTSAEGSFFIDPNESSTGKFTATVRGNSGFNSRRFTRPSAAAFHNYVFNLDMSADGTDGNEIASIFVDGAVQSLTNVAANNNTSNFAASETLSFLSRTGGDLFGAGRMANLGIYGGINLSADEAADYGGGLSPLLIRPDKLPHFWPMNGNDAGFEPDIIGGAHATVIGATETDNPAIFMPSPAIIGIPVAAAGGVANPWYYYAQQAA